MFNNMIITLKKSIKKHPFSSFLWFIAVPVGSCVGMIYNIMDMSYEQVLNDINNGYFYTVSISIVLSIVFELVCSIAYNYKNKDIDKLKIFLLVVSYVLSFLSLLVFKTKFGNNLIVQIITSLILIIFAFVARTIFIYEPEDYATIINKEINSSWLLDGS